MINGPSNLIRTVIRHPLTRVTIFGRSLPAGMVIVDISFGIAGSLQGVLAKKSNDATLNEVAARISGFLSGSVASLSDLPLDNDGFTRFQKAVHGACRRIPRGTTVSYSRLARMAGYPRAVRAAATVMRNNRFPLAIPCHRVVAKDGSIGGFMGAASGEPIKLKLALLRMEGADTAHLRVAPNQRHA